MCGCKFVSLSKGFDYFLVKLERELNSILFCGLTVFELDKAFSGCQNFVRKISKKGGKILKDIPLEFYHHLLFGFIAIK